MRSFALLFALSLLAARAEAATPAPAGAPSFVVDAEESDTPTELFTQIETALRDGDIAAATKSLGRQVFVSLKGGESGYFSANQASSILQSFFSARRTLSFTFTTIQKEGDPFATGSGTFLVKGARETLQVYVAVSRQGHRWVISQFNIY